MYSFHLGKSLKNFKEIKKRKFTTQTYRMSGVWKYCSPTNLAPLIFLQYTIYLTPYIYDNIPIYLIPTKILTFQFPAAMLASICSGKKE